VALFEEASQNTDERDHRRCIATIRWRYYLSCQNWHRLQLEWHLKWRIGKKLTQHYSTMLAKPSDRYGVNKVFAPDPRRLFGLAFGMNGGVLMLHLARLRLAWCSWGLWKNYIDCTEKVYELDDVVEERTGLAQSYVDMTYISHQALTLHLYRSADACWSRCVELHVSSSCRSVLFIFAKLEYTVLLWLDGSRSQELSYHWGENFQLCKIITLYNLLLTSTDHIGMAGAW